MTGIGFGYALSAIKAGRRVAREGWNGKGMFIFLVDQHTVTCFSESQLYAYDEPPAYHDFCIEPHLVMKTADDKFIPWLASQSDLLANDWSVLNG